MPFLTNCHLAFLTKRHFLAIFEKNGNFLAIFMEKIAIFWHFFKIFKRQSFGGLGLNLTDIHPH